MRLAFAVAAHFGPEVLILDEVLAIGDVGFNKKRTATEKKKRLLLKKKSNRSCKMAEPTGFEPATSDVTGRRSNQLNYDSAFSNLRF